MWGLLRDRMSSCDPTYLGIKATGQVAGGGGMQREGEAWRGGPKGRRQWGPAVSRQGVVQKSGGRVTEGTMPSGLGWCGHRGRAWLSPLGSHGTSPKLLRLHPHSPGSAPAPPPARWQFLQRLDGTQSHVQRLGREAAGPPWTGAPGWPGQLRVIGWGGPGGAGPPLDSG